MTPDELDAIHKRFESGGKWNAGDFMDALMLLGEVNRLREGIEAMTTKYGDVYAGDAVQSWAVTDDLDELLNPTEGGEL